MKNSREKEKAKGRAQEKLNQKEEPKEDGGINIGR